MHVEHEFYFLNHFDGPIGLVQVNIYWLPIHFGNKKWCG